MYRIFLYLLLLSANGFIYSITYSFLMICVFARARACVRVIIWRDSNSKCTKTWQQSKLTKANQWENMDKKCNSAYFSKIYCAQLIFTVSYSNSLTQVATGKIECWARWTHYRMQLRHILEPTADEKAPDDQLSYQKLNFAFKIKEQQIRCQKQKDAIM